MVLEPSLASAISLDYLCSCYADYSSSLAYIYLAAFHRHPFVLQVPLYLPNCPLNSDSALQEV